MLKEALIDVGVTASTASTAAREMASNAPARASLTMNHGVNPDELVNPWPAAGASALAFTLGAALPLLATLVASPNTRALTLLIVTFVSLILTGAISGKLSDTPLWKSATRLVVGGAIGMAFSYGVGLFFNTPLGG